MSDWEFSCSKYNNLEISHTVCDGELLNGLHEMTNVFTRRNVLTILCPAAAKSPAYHTLENKEKNRNRHDPLLHRSTLLESMASLADH